nr:hypothetical protein [Clostridia bacterium]
VHCVELGANLAAILQEKYAGYPMTVDVGPFESWTPARPYRVRMIYCATAFHWLDPGIKYRKCHDLLTPDGHLTLLWNGPDSMSDPLIAQAYEILWAHCGRKKEEDREATIERRKAEIAESGLFVLDNFLDHPWIHTSPRRNFIEGFFAQSSYLSLPEHARQSARKQVIPILTKLEDHSDRRSIRRRTSSSG